MSNYINASPIKIDFEFNSKVRILFPGEPFIVSNDQDYLLNERYRAYGILPYNSNSKLDELYDTGLSLFKTYVDEKISGYKVKADKLRDEKLSRPVILSPKEKEYIALRNKIAEGQKKRLSGQKLFSFVYPHPVDFERGIIQEVKAIDSLRSQFNETRVKELKAV